MKPTESTTEKKNQDSQPGNLDQFQSGLPLEIRKTATALKFDENKLDWSLVPWDSIEEILKVLEFGKNKYAAWNFCANGGLDHQRVLNAAFRHLIAYQKGEDIDPETGLSHISHLGCNVLFLLHFINNPEKYTKDNRPCKILN